MRCVPRNGHLVTRLRNTHTLDESKHKMQLLQPPSDLQNLPLFF
jgi:hypothetical protein